MPVDPDIQREAKPMPKTYASAKKYERPLVDQS
jgi:hypothetical protein